MSDHVPSPQMPPPPSPPDVTVWGRAPRRRPAGVVLWAILAAVVLLGGALAFVLSRGGDSAEAQPLALSFAEGHSETYAIHQTMDGVVDADALGSQSLEMDVTQVVTWRVASVDDGGVATIEVTVSEMSGTVNGVEIPSGSVATLPVEIRVAPDGRVLSAGGLALGGADQMQGFGFPGMGQMTPILPDEGDAVAPGDTWDKHFSQKFPFGKGTIEFTATSTYDRNEDVNGVEAAVIVTEMTVPLDFTLDFAKLLSQFGEELGATGATGLGELEDATIVYGGEGSFTQTSFLDLGARQLLRTQSAGEFDIAMQFGGIPGFEGAMAFTGTFTQELERR